MNRSVKILFLLFLLLSVDGFAQVKRFLSLADNAVFVADYQKAKKYYLKALARRPDNYKANLGIAILYTDYMENFESSLSYLEKALKTNPKKDTAPALMFALARNFEYVGKFDSAIYYFQRLKRYDDLDDKLFDKKLDQNIRNCDYAKKNTEVISPQKLYVVNAGKNINTEMPEYVPVLTGKGKMIFTSKRKDDDKEKINQYNGQYFESMYISDIHNGRTSSAKMFTIPKSYLMSKLSMSDESVISVLPDGNQIYLYKNGKIYQGDLMASIEHPKKLDKIINFDYYQNHASLSKDGQTIYFTSESMAGNGSNDIYKCTKKADGTWGNRENLGKVINTALDEEAPFIADDNKTLYFSSKGHDGYGGFDIFKSVYENGKWSTPENLGLPINSTGNDIFYIVNATGTAGYFSSNRAGGMGDFDIYKINFTDKLNLDCNSIDATTLNIDANSKPGERNKYTFSASIPDNMKDKIISFNWSINDSVISDNPKNIEFSFNTIGNYFVRAKMVAWCDTCINPYIACAEKNLSIQNIENISSDLSSAVSLNSNSKGELKGKIGETGSVNVADSKGETAKLKVSKTEGIKYYTSELKDFHGELTKEQTEKLGIEISPVYFDYNSTIVKDAGIKEIETVSSMLLNYYPNITISVVGYTDSKGTKKNNQILSLKRAFSVKNHFVKEGFDKTKIITKGRGENNLVNKCSDHIVCDEAQHQQNRRVEIKLIKR